MTTMARVVFFLRNHCEPRGFAQLTQEVRELFPSPGEGLRKAEFYVADGRRRCFFEFFESTHAGEGAGNGHEGNIVVVQGDEVLTLLRCRGGAGDIWESFMLPVDGVKYVAFRTRVGRR